MTDTDMGRFVYRFTSPKEEKIIRANSPQIAVRKIFKNRKSIPGGFILELLGIPHTPTDALVREKAAGFPVVGNGMGAEAIDDWRFSSSGCVLVDGESS